MSSWHRNYKICDIQHICRAYGFYVQANGTPESIYLWGKQAFPHNALQQRAFEILAAKFVLSFLCVADIPDITSNGITNATHSQYCRCTYLLKQMVGEPAQYQHLIMLLTGAGGSGKSAVIYHLVQYGKAYCSYIKQPFTTMTILVTTASDHASILTNKHKFHSATFLHKTVRQIDAREKADFCNTVRMIIIDDVFTLSSADIQALNKRLRWLRSNDTSLFGGIDTIFVGDSRRLPPFPAKPIYDRQCHDFRMSINCFISLPEVQYTCHDIYEISPTCLCSILTPTKWKRLRVEQPAIMECIQQQQRGHLHHHCLVCTFQWHIAPIVF